MVKLISELRLSDDIVLPVDAVTETFAFIAKRRVGKSNAAVVMAEQMYFAGIPWVAIDPKGDWWGVRSSADGHGEGLSVVVFGGKHGDRPLHPDSGAFMAELIASRRITCILDVSEFNQAEKIRFLVAFATRLLQVNEEPLHLFFEECDDYIPQNLIGRSGGDDDETKLVRAFSRLIRHGGFKGIGASLITQRAALVSKNVLAQVDTFIALRTTEPLDIKVVGDRLKGHPLSKEIVESLPSMKAGDAWIISPAFLETCARTTFYRRSTFDSGRTPKIGEKRVVPTRLADVELDEITAAMATIIEQVEATDPDKLTKKIAAQTATITRLEHEVSELRKLADTAPPEVEVPVEVEVEVHIERVPPAVRGQVDELYEALGALVADTEKRYKQAAGLVDLIDGVNAAPARVRQEPKVADGARRRLPSAPAPSRPPTRVQHQAAPERIVTAFPPAHPDEVADVKLKSGARKMLDVLARQYPLKVTGRQLATMCGIRYRAGTYNSYLSALNVNDLIEKQGEFLLLTARGWAVTGIDPFDNEPLTTDEIVQMYRSKLKAGARQMLDALVDAYPDGIAGEALADLIGVAYRAGTYNSYLSALNVNGLITKNGGKVYANAAVLQLQS